jgi:hypothetical protein
MSPSRSWSASGRRPVTAPRSRGPRPAGSLTVSIARARDIWDDLTGGPKVDLGPDPDALEPGDIVASDRVAHRFGYSDIAAAGIVDLALALWPDTAATMGDDGSADDGG